ncbi:MAG TPA: 16S rRNA (adenine(1518)-N(6)/adenine(1519)-N(6))-dimethyltransferase RsmA [Bacteroidota bacterium]|nr:16S rRNA (adenine(1518)-N(6)/adenine(1519)-N(6))-dimethyltransferase RsmA [Bacteroidota bacterium]
MPPPVAGFRTSRHVTAPPPLRLRPRKSLGQNFLRDDNMARKIAAAINPQQEDCLLEIGPGEGALTRHLAGRCRTLAVVDIDERVVAAMRTMFPGIVVEVILGDFLATDLSAFAASHPGRFRVAGNIPYNITTPILFHVLDNRGPVHDLTITVQKEVGQRMLARPGGGEYGILSVFCNYFAEVRALFEVPRDVFYPKPDVTSVVMQLTMRRRPVHPASDERFFREMVRSVFGKRRKTLRNSLRYFTVPRGILLPELPVLRRRPEELSLRELVDLSNALLQSAPTPNPGTDRR